jgi:hypothetical protein
MKKEKLKFLRTIVPGIILLLIFSPFVIYKFDDLIEKNFSGNFGIISIFALPFITIFVYFFGGLYYALDIRRKLYPKFNIDSEKNIILRFLQFYNSRQNTNIQYSQIQAEEQKLLHFFYKFVDKDETLSNKAMDVYQNGIWWSTSVDLANFSFLGFLFYFFVFLSTKQLCWIFLSITLLFIFFIFAILFQPYILKKHIKLSDGQIDFIFTTYRDNLLQDLHGLFFDERSDKTHN